MNHDIGVRLPEQRAGIAGDRYAKRLLEPDHFAKIVANLGWIAIDSTNHLQTALSGSQTGDTRADRPKPVMHNSD